MSKPPIIAKQQEALSVYFKDMLTDSFNIAEFNDQYLNEPVTTLPQDSQSTNDWRNMPFQALLFDVQGLQLAVPLHELNVILTIPEKPLPKLPDKPAWYIGLHLHHQSRIQVIDTAHIVLPQGYQHQNKAMKYIIVIDDNKWGLTCNQIIQVITLFPEHVRWRKKLGKRPWLAGTAITQMCSILDIEKLAKQLEQR